MRHILKRANGAIAKRKLHHENADIMPEKVSGLSRTTLWRERNGKTKLARVKKTIHETKRLDTFFKVRCHRCRLLLSLTLITDTRQTTSSKCCESKEDSHKDFRVFS